MLFQDNIQEILAKQEERAVSFSLSENRSYEDYTILVSIDREIPSPVETKCYSELVDTYGMKLHSQKELIEDLASVSDSKKINFRNVRYHQAFPKDIHNPKNLVVRTSFSYAVNHFSTKQEFEQFVKNVSSLFKKHNIEEKSYEELK